MSPGPAPSIQFNTARVVLRPASAADAERAFEIQSDWDVTRMLRMAAFPPDRAEFKRWFAEHSQEWLEARGEIPWAYSARAAVAATLAARRLPRLLTTCHVAQQQP
jgi:RimJ/RimL family protein N-acetyltransferase